MSSSLSSMSLDAPPAAPAHHAQDPARSGFSLPSLRLADQINELLNLTLPMFRPPRKADPPARPPPPAVGGAPAQAPAVPAPGAPPAGTAPAAAPNPYAGNIFSFSIHIFFSSHDHCSRRPRPAAVPGAADDADAVRELHADAGRLQPVRRVPAARRRARPAPARLPPAVLPAAAAVRPRPRPGISATAGVSNIPLPLSLTYGI